MGDLATTAEQSSRVEPPETGGSVRVAVSATSVHSDALSAGNAGPLYEYAVTPVGIDLSLKCTGISWRRGDGKVCTLSVTSQKRSKVGKYTHSLQTERLVKLTREILRIAQTFPFGQDPGLNVMIESPAYGAVGRASDLAQLHGAVRYGLASLMGITPRYVEALTVRRMVLGGGCKKDAAVEKVTEVFGLDFQTKDECDAYLIMRAAEIAACPNPKWLLPDLRILVKKLRMRNE